MSISACTGMVVQRIRGDSTCGDRGVVAGCLARPLIRNELASSGSGKAAEMSVKEFELRSRTPFAAGAG
jgi:hypothetical protein